MEILIEKSRVMVDQNVDHVKNVSYAYTPWKDNVTLFINNSYKMASIRDIVVNGIQMTADNIDELLIDLFKEECCGNNESAQSDWLESKTTNASFINNRPYTQLVFVENMVFPEAICTGHTLEIIKDDQPYKTYQWNGWLWEIIGQEPNLIFKGVPEEEIDNTYYSSYFFYRKSDDLHFFTIDKNIPISNPYFLDNKLINVTTSDIIKNDNFIIIQNLNYYVDLENQKAEEVIEGYNDLEFLNIYYLRGSQDVELPKSKDLYIKNVSTRLGMNIFQSYSNVYIENTRFGVFTWKAFYNRISCSSLKITNSNCDIITVEVNNPIIEGEHSIVDVSNNTRYLDLELIYKGVKNSSLFLKGNSDFRQLKVVGENYIQGNSIERRSKINNLDFELNASSIEKVSISNIEFSEVAFSNLVDTLASVAVADIPFTYTDCIPTLTDEDKTRLAIVGWKL